MRPEAVLTQWQENIKANEKSKAAQIKAGIVQSANSEENTASIEEEYNPALALKMVARLNQSLDINPLDANSHLLIASYYQLLANNTPGEYKKFTMLAAASYQQAIQHQPTWDYAWAKQANFYSNQLPINQAAVELALSKAVLFGPFERKTQEILIPLIFKHWPLLFDNKKNQEQSIKVIKHALKYSYANLTLTSAKKYQRLTEIEPLLTKQWHKNRIKKYLREAAND